jgi:mannose/fructose/N-acetylgalactosamine-specific phosphotransferase system component IIC
MVGVAAAHLMRMASYKLTNSLDSLLQRTVKVETAQRETIRRSYANILSKTVYWAVVLFFIAAAANLLGWKLFSEWMSTLLEYLPKLITGLLIS